MDIDAGGGIPVSIEATVKSNSKRRAPKLSQLDLLGEEGCFSKFDRRDRRRRASTSGTSDEDIVAPVAVVLKSRPRPNDGAMSAIAVLRERRSHARPFARGFLNWRHFNDKMPPCYIEERVFNGKKFNFKIFEFRRLFMRVPEILISA